VAVIVDHGVWFMFFTQNYYEFEEVVAFFTINVWLIPFSYFISLSANDNTLPYGVSNTVSAEDFTYPLGSKKRGKRASRFLTFLNFLKQKRDALLPTNRSQKLF